MDESEDTTNGIALTVVAAEVHKGHKKRHLRNGVNFWLSTSFSATFGLLSLESVSFLLGYFISIFLIPFEIIRLVTQVESLVHKKAAWYLIVGALVAGIITLLYFAANDAVRWGVHTGIAAGFVGASPIIFTVVFGLMTLASSADFIKAFIEHRKKPECRTPLRKVNLLYKGVNSGSLLVMTAFIMPFVLFPQFMPIFLTIMLVAFTAYLTIRIAKWVYENHTWKNTIKELKEDPYDVLFEYGERKEFEAKLNHEAVAKKEMGYLQKIKAVFAKIGGGEDKDSAAYYIKDKFELKIQAATDPDEKLKIQRSFDLLRKTRGRLLEHETTSKPYKKAKGSDGMPVVVVDKTPKGNSSGNVFESPKAERKRDPDLDPLLGKSAERIADSKDDIYSVRKK